MFRDAPGTVAHTLYAIYTYEAREEEEEEEGTTIIMKLIDGVTIREYERGAAHGSCRCWRRGCRRNWTSCAGSRRPRRPTTAPSDGGPSTTMCLARSAGHWSTRRRSRQCCSSTSSRPRRAHSTAPVATTPASRSVSTHGDLHGNNIIVRPDGSLALIDLESAGFFPAYYEVLYVRYYYHPVLKLFDGEFVDAVGIFHDAERICRGQSGDGDDDNNTDDKNNAQEGKENI
ncbi:hypothetical protein SAMD00023353_1102110 [Rosellinia necatrix]|uniref:Aminoglycoside phosphotransferase domain-containing protein n=1 Tax=Rosellinia necatrix TaxID=77044 RepID=A0A1S7UMT6_ROSNE|nr:hypothetical protein SAMD00023353_1102110 [Rosellinia necatrix]